MKRLSIRVAFIMAFVPALAAADANGRLNKGGLGGVAFDAIPACRLPVGVVSYSDQKDMPAALREAIKKKLGYFVPPNSPFDATDVVMTGHNRRLIFIWVRGTRWVIATERGGRGYNDPILAYEVTPNRLQAKFVAERVAFPDSVCLTAAELLNQQATTAPVERK
jgi:hypothetical protein